MRSTRMWAMYAGLAGLALVATGCTSTPASTPASAASSSSTSSAAKANAATPTPTPTVDPRIAIDAHLVAQEGLAIALASTVLQSQLLLVEYSLGDSSGCHKLPGGGSSKVSGRTAKGSAVTLTDHIFYDTKCATPYIVEPATITQSSGGDAFTATATATYTAADGTALGSMTTDAHASLAGTGIELEGLGKFTSASGFTASLGLACQPTSKETVLDCQGGVAQDFASLETSLGSVTPLRLTIGAKLTDELHFTGTSNTTSTGAPGAVSITSPDSKTLAVTGGTSATSTIATKGKAGGFVLFPPTPTGWTVTDAAHDVAFAITVTDDKTRTLTGSVTRPSTGATLGSLSVDKSGTGTVTWTGQSPSPVTSWLLGG